MKRGFSCIFLCVFFRYLPQFVFDTGYAVEARIFGEDMATLSICYMSFYLIDNKGLALKTAVSFLILLILTTMVTNFFLFSTFYTDFLRMIFDIILALIAFLAIPLVALKLPVKEFKVYDQKTIHLVMRRPTSIICCLFSSLFEQCDSCSVVVGSNWHRFNKKSGLFESVPAENMNNEKYIVVSTGIKIEDQGLIHLKRMIGGKYSLLKNNCCSVFWGIFEPYGMRFTVSDLIPTVFAHKVMKHAK